MVLTMAKILNAVSLPAIWCIAGLTWAGATVARIIHKVRTHGIELFRRERTNSLSSCTAGSAGSGVTRRAAGTVGRIATGSCAGSAGSGVTRRAAGAVRRVATGSCAGSAGSGVTRRAAGAVRRVATGSRAGSAGSGVTRRAAGAVHVLSTDALHIRRGCSARNGIVGLSECAIANQQAAANSTHNP